jgi:arylsulfatase A-like enzyme
MKGTTWEGGYRVPCLVRWPGRVPAGRSIDALATTPDLFPTSLAAAGIAPSADVVLDGRDLMPVLLGKAEAVHDVLISHMGEKVASIRDARFKLHLLEAKDRKDAKPGERWIDPRGPDGVTILAPYEQYPPSEYPGLRTGDATAALTLFDLAADPGEQLDVASKHPEVVSRLKKSAERYEAGVRK